MEPDGWGPVRRAGRRGGVLEAYHTPLTGQFLSEFDTSLVMMKSLSKPSAGRAPPCAAIEEHGSIGDDETNAVAPRGERRGEPLPFQGAEVAPDEGAGTGHSDSVPEGASKVEGRSQLQGGAFLRLIPATDDDDRRLCDSPQDQQEFTRCQGWNLLRQEDEDGVPFQRLEQTFDGALSREELKPLAGEGALEAPALDLVGIDEQDDLFDHSDSMVRVRGRACSAIRGTNKGRLQDTPPPDMGQAVLLAS